MRMPASPDGNDERGEDDAWPEEHREARSALWRLILPVAAALLVLVASSLNALDAVRPALQALWSARWDRLGDAPAVDPALPAEALKQRIVTLLNDPVAIGGVAGPGQVASYSFDGCVLVLSVRAEPEICARPGTDRRLLLLEQRIDLRNLLTHPAFVSERGLIVPGGEPGSLREELRWIWVPRIARAVEEELHRYLLLDPRVLGGPDSDARHDRATSLVDAIEAGDIGEVVRQTHRQAFYCSGERAIEPFAERSVAVHVTPDTRAALIDLVHGLGKRACGSRGWLIEW